MSHIILAGGSGFLGGLLTHHFEAEGHTLQSLTRHPPRHPREIQWDGRTCSDWTACLDGADVLINLCGKSVNCRYNPRNRRELIESRILPTRILGQAMREVSHPPPLWINASTATLYKHRPEPTPWDEQGEIAPHPDAKDAFSIELATAWENAFHEAVPPGVRAVALRSAMVLGRDRDANNVLTVLRRLVRLGLGGPMASGNQYVSWIHEEDFCKALSWIVTHPELVGPVNLCAPNPLPNAEMMRRLRQNLARPFGLPAPRILLEFGAFFLRTETELILKSRNVIPGKLLQSGFTFRFSAFESAIEDLL